MITIIRKIIFILNIPRVIFVMFPLLDSSNMTILKNDLNKFIQKGEIKDDSILSIILLLYTNRYYRNIYYFRFPKSKIFRFLLPQAEDLFIPSYTKIGSSICFAHPYCTFLNAKSIGENFVFRHMTTIGNKFDDKPNEIPSIGNNVSLGAHVIIIGNIHIGNNVIVGAGSVVTKDIPDNCIVAGNPARVIKKNNG